MSQVKVDEGLEPAGAARLRSTGAALGAFVRRIPVSLGLAVLLIVTAAVTGTMFGEAGDPTLDAWGVGVSTTLLAGRWWTPATALAIPYDPFQLVAGVVLVVLLLGVAERKLGSARAALAFVVTGVVAMTVGVLVQWGGSLIGEWWALGTAADRTLDPLTGVVGALLAATAFMSALWRRRIRVVTLAFVLVFVLYDGDSSNVYRLIAGVAGLLLGAWFAKDASTLRPVRSSHRETRNLLATVVAITAIGPVVALLHQEEFTPFSLTATLFTEGIPDRDAVLAQCEDVTSAFCDRELALLSAEGPGMVALVFLPLVLLLLAAWGLRNGRRFALILAVAVNIALALLAWFSFDVASTVAELEGAEGWTAFDIGELIVWALATVLLPLVVAAVLLAFRRDFAIRAPYEAVVRFTTVTVGTLLLLAATYFVTALAVIEDYVPDANLTDLAIDTVKRFLPVQFVAAFDPIVVPDHDLAFVLFQVVGPLFWIVFIVAAVPFLSATADRSAMAGRSRIRALLKRGGGGSLGFMATWPGNVYWFSDDGEAAVAYRVVNGIAITMSDPICLPERDEQTVREFAAFCDASSLTPVFYSVHEQYLPIFESMGWQHTSVGEETVVRTQGLELTGKAWQKVRQPLNRAIKEGLTTVWTSWDELPLTTVTAIRAISEDWVSEKELPEMGFTLGGLDELKDRDVRLMLAIGPDERLQAVTSWLPTYRDGQPIGWTIDFMRRADQSMSGVMEFVIASAALHMKETGVEFLSLSGAPLATKPLAPGETPPPPTAMSRLLDWLGKTLEPAYGFTSLFRFKAKFNPEYRTISMAYPDPLALPAIGVAIGRAYLPEISPKEAVALVKTLTTGS